VDLPAQAPRHAYGLDFHENKCRTPMGASGQASMRNEEWNNAPSMTLQKTRLMERTTLRHLTQEEISLNQQELACSAEIEQLEMQETSLAGC
jgi:hypothetical protein